MEPMDQLQSIWDLSQTGRYAEAESTARALLTTLPQAGETVFLLAYAIHQQGRLEEGIPQYELALRYTPAHPSALNNLGTILRQLGRSEEALVQFRQASEADPEKSCCVGAQGVRVTRQTHCVSQRARHDGRSPRPSRRDRGLVAAQSRNC